MAADVLAPGFWEIGNYKHNVRRIKDGLDQLDEFAKMARERADIEAKYSKMLNQFSEKWQVQVEKSVPAGCIKTNWLELIGEASTLAEIHGAIRHKLIDEIVRDTQNFKKNNLHVTVFKGPKEIREIEEGYEKAQKPWKKRFDKMEDKKKAYYNTCRLEKSALVNLQNSQADTSVSEDGASKMRDRHEKLKEEVQKTKNDYETAVKNLNDYKDVYIGAMAHVFKLCQEKELARCEFLVQTFHNTQKFLGDLVKNEKIHEHHKSMETIVQNTGPDTIRRDLSAWSKTNGYDAPMEWPQFVEYSTDFRSIGSKSSAKDAGGVVLTRQTTKSDDVPSASVVHERTDSEKHSTKSSSTDSDTNTLDSRGTAPVKDKPAARPHAPGHSQQHSTHSNSNWAKNQPLESPPLTADSPDSEKYGDFEEYAGKPASVLYDYIPVEGDEIPLRKGEVVEVLSDPDSLGWCTGRRNGEVGLFPASYVQVVQ